MLLRACVRQAMADLRNQALVSVLPMGLPPPPWDGGPPPSYAAPPADEIVGAAAGAAWAAEVFAEMDTDNNGAIRYVELRNWIGQKMREDAALTVQTITDEMRKVSLAAFEQHKRVSDDRLIDDSLGVEEVASLLQAMHLTAKAASDAAPEQVEIVDVMKYVPTQVPRQPEQGAGAARSEAAEQRRRREEAERQRRELEEQHRRDEEELRRIQQAMEEAEKKKKAEEEAARKKAKEEADRKKVEEAKRKLAEQQRPPPPSYPEPEPKPDKVVPEPTPGPEPAPPPGYPQPPKPEPEPPAPPPSYPPPPGYPSAPPPSYPQPPKEEPEPEPPSPSYPRPAPAPDQKFVHIDPHGKRERFSDADNRLISQARAAGAPSVRIGDVCLPNGCVLSFEVRFQAPWGKLPQRPESGMCQVNLGSRNTRVVEEEPHEQLPPKPPPAPAPAPAPPPTPAPAPDPWPPDLKGNRPPNPLARWEPPDEQPLEDTSVVVPPSPQEASAPPPTYQAPTKARDLYDIWVPRGCGPGSTVIASLFRVKIPPFNEIGVPMREGQKFRVEFEQHQVRVPHGGYPGSKIKTWVHRSTTHPGFEGADQTPAALCSSQSGLVGVLGSELRACWAGHYIVPAGFSAGQTLTIM